MYAGEDFEQLACVFMPPHDADAKERLFDEGWSRQFHVLNNPNLLAPQPLALIAPRHSPALDRTLLRASIDKRLRFRRSEHPYAITPQDEILGFELFSSLCEVYGRSVNSREPFDAVLYAECIADNEYAQLTNKTKATIVANADRSDPDWRYTTVRIFAKAQHKVNDGSIFGDWKACQTLALMHDAVILLLGPVKKYQRAFDKRDRPAKVYSHTGASPLDLSRWCRRTLTCQRATTNDYTAFDQSQHGEAVVLERLKMQRLCIPTELIDLHVWLKTNVNTQFGPLTCMRLTGEPGTYDDNTDYNLAILNLQYQLELSQGILASGDDSAVFPPPSTRPTWLRLAPHFALRAKTVEQDHPLFCGYYLGPAGAVRDPYALFAKLAVALDEDTLWAKLPSYLAEFALGHSLGQSLHSLLPLGHYPYQAAVFDLLCRRATPAQKLALRAPGEDLSAIAQSIRSAPYLNVKARAILASLGERYSALRPAFRANERPLDDPVWGELLPQ